MNSPNVHYTEKYQCDFIISFEPYFTTVNLALYNQFHKVSELLLL